MNELHLFAGAGGGILGGMLLGHTPVCAVEIDPYCRQVLEERQADGSLPPFPVLEDVRAFDGNPWRGKVDVVCGGFPCQPWSSAGKQLGTDDPRHLWPEMARIIGEVRPRYVFAENVSLAAFEEPWRDLRRMGYRVPPAICVSASDVGAPHLRKRWWLLAIDSNGIGEGSQRITSIGQAPEPPGVGDASDADSELRDRSGAQRQSGRAQLANACGVDGDTDRNGQPAIAVDDEASGVQGVGDTDRSRLEERQGQRGDPCAKLQTAIGTDRWAVEPDVRRVADGVASRVDRLRALGNGQVPQCAAQAWRVLMAQSVEGAQC